MLAALSLALSWPGLADSRRPWSDAPRPLAFGALALQALVTAGETTAEQIEAFLAELDE